MFKCTYCSKNVKDLLTVYGAGHMVLARCDNCDNVADIYIEHNSMLIFIDMLLHKRPVYRHLLFNRDFVGQASQKTKKRSLLAAIASFATVLILFEVYIKWHILEKLYLKEPSIIDDTLYLKWSLPAQYLHVLFYCILEFTSFRAGILAAVWLGRWSAPSTEQLLYATVLSFSSKGLILAVGIWDYGSFEYSRLLNLLTVTSTIETVAAVLDCSWTSSLVIVIWGLVGQFLFQQAWMQFDPTVKIWSSIY